jgi:hypothetical protein
VAGDRGGRSIRRCVPALSKRPSWDGRVLLLADLDPGGLPLQVIKVKLGGPPPVDRTHGYAASRSRRAWRNSHSSGGTLPIIEWGRTAL